MKTRTGFYLSVRRARRRWVRRSGVADEGGGCDGSPGTGASSRGDAGRPRCTTRARSSLSRGGTRAEETDWLMHDSSVRADLWARRLEVRVSCTITAGAGRADQVLAATGRPARPPGPGRGTGRRARPESRCYQMRLFSIPVSITRLGSRILLHIKK